MNKPQISEENEATAYPFWIIIDPRQNFHTNDFGLHNIANMITGIWLSREAAQNHLNAKRHRFGKSARVFCHSGHDSWDWKNLVKYLVSADTQEGGS